MSVMGSLVQKVRLESESDGVIRNVARSRRGRRRRDPPLSADFDAQREFVARQHRPRRRPEPTNAPQFDNFKGPPGWGRPSRSPTLRGRRRSRGAGCRRSTFNSSRSASARGYFPIDRFGLGAEQVCREDSSRTSSECRPTPARRPSRIRGTRSASGARRPGPARRCLSSGGSGVMNAITSKRVRQGGFDQVGDVVQAWRGHSQDVAKDGPQVSRG